VPLISRVLCTHTPSLVVDKPGGGPHLVHHQPVHVRLVELQVPVHVLVLVDVAPGVCPHCCVLPQCFTCFFCIHQGGGGRVVLGGDGPRGRRHFYIVTAGVLNLSTLSCEVLMSPPVCAIIVLPLRCGANAVPRVVAGDACGRVAHVVRSSQPQRLFSREKHVVVPINLFILSLSPIKTNLFVEAKSAPL